MTSLCVYLGFATQGVLMLFKIGFNLSLQSFFIFIESLLHCRGLPADLLQHLLRDAVHRLPERENATMNVVNLTSGSPKGGC